MRSAKPPLARREMSAVAPTNEGMTRGRGARIDQNLRPGRSVRAVSQAKEVPISTAAAVTVKANKNELPSGTQSRLLESNSEKFAPRRMFS